ncbi:UNVERIFIED_CONTAM: tRNA (cytosine-5-)-methyltransferase [Siphonaria sp. JEL0065]|nr:tRNA (cytosine-5-)-methyltransferase [Siphonaria sp. JEL0065]
MSPNDNTHHITALEFFCGIGGLHYGLQYSQSDSPITTIKVPAAFDINHVTNAIYTHNFKTQPLQTAIEKLSKKDLDKYQATTWLLSPPCQPFTRGGKKLDHKDARSKGLLHLINLLPTLDFPPTYILLENVLNFEVSRSRDLLVSMLVKEGYVFEEWLLSPLQFGIPNDRKRYYLTARRLEGFVKHLQDAKDVPEVKKDDGQKKGRKADKEKKEDERVVESDDNEEGEGDEEDALVAVELKLKTEWPYPVPPTHEISHYLDKGLQGQIGGSTPHMPSSQHSAATKVTKEGVGSNVEALKIPEAFVKKRKFISDGYVVGPAEKKSACFTKAYGHHGIGAGSFLQTKGFDIPKNLEDPAEAVETYGLRFFSPTEVARLHGFPVPDALAEKGEGEKRVEGFKEFTFPEATTLIQRYRVLGNSLNVVVVGELLKRAVFSS